MPHDTDGLLSEAHQLTGMLFRVVDRAQRDFADVAQSEALTPPLARMMLMLEQPQPMRVLAEHLRCDASNVTGLTDRLAERGLVERVPDAADRRIKLISLTREGRQVRSRLSRKVAEGSTVTRCLSDAQRRQLRPLLATMLGAEASGD